MDKSRTTARHQHFLRLLKSARRESGLTQQQLADRLGKHQSFVAKYETGERRLDMIEFLAVAEAIGIDPVALVSRLAAEDSQS